MRTRKKKVVVAMSGGVDSSVAAGLLVEQGYDVEGVSLRMWEGAKLGPRNCSDYRGAKEIAAILSVPHTLLDLRSAFDETVVKPFAQEYLRGRTPNPCVACNRDFKLGALLDWAKRRGADYVATGHYAAIARDNADQCSLCRGADRAKDQSYFLFALSQDQLAHTLFPLGHMQKKDVREQASRMRLPVAEKPESQDICFGDYKTLVEAYADQNEIEGGEIVDRTGTVLGWHDGIHGLTVGQRKGLGLSAPHPLYVLQIEEATKRVVVGAKHELACRGLVANGVNWIEAPRKEEIAAEVQIRYRSAAVPCSVRAIGRDSYEVYFDQESVSVTPGQAAVFYRGERVLGGGWIERAIRA
jgi:tRNA-specific 2-thiouridylase